MTKYIKKGMETLNKKCIDTIIKIQADLKKNQIEFLC